MPASGRTACKDCPLLECKGLRPLDSAQIAFMQSFKQGEMSVDKGTPVLVQGAISPHLYTILEGVLIRYKLLEDGRRQILNFMFPGDLVGLQGAMNEPLAHGVEALTDATLCVLPRARLAELFREQSELGFDITWLAAKEEAALEEHLATLGQRRAKERIAYLALFLMQRGIETGVTRNKRLDLTVTQAQVADMLGLSVVHTNRSMQALRKSGLLSWTLDAISVRDLDEAREFAKFDQPLATARPFI